MQRFAWRASDGRPDFGPAGPAPRGASLLAPSEATSYAVACCEPEFRGRFCVGLPPGRYGAEELSVRGVAVGSVRSLRLVGGVGVRVYSGEESATEEPLWESGEDAAALPEGVEGAFAVVEVVAAPAVVAAV